MDNIKFKNNNSVFQIHTRGIPYLSFNILDDIGVPNLYTTRYASYSKYSAYSDEECSGIKGLRLAWMKNEKRDEAVPVITSNMKILTNQIGADFKNICITNQLHTNHVDMVSLEDLGYGIKPKKEDGVDGLVTDEANAVLLAYGADCPPVYLADPVAKVVGLVHAGRKGTFGRISQVAIDKMVNYYGSKLENIRAAIGPGICVDCYEMGDEIYDELKSLWGSYYANKLMMRYTANGSSKYHLDLWKANEIILLEAGISKRNIAVTNVCTCCNSDLFYSYRAGNMKNEQAAIIANSFNSK